MNKKVLPATPFGPVVIIWDQIASQSKIIHVLIPYPDQTAIERAEKQYPDALEKSCDIIETVAVGIYSILHGKPARIPLSIIALERCSPFQRKVLKTLHTIPAGSVITYGELAKRSGSPNAARAVGTAMARNPFPLIIPCHRVIRADATLGHFQGGQQMKSALLALEHPAANLSQRSRCVKTVAPLVNSFEACF